MKADVQSSADPEKEALQWAVNVFRERAADLTPEGSKRCLEEGAVNALIGWHDSMTGDDDEVDHLALYVNAVRKGLRSDVGIQELCKVAAILLERGDKLPQPLRSFIVEFLRNPNVGVRRGPGPNFYDLKHRNLTIAFVILHIVETWKFPATRNRASKRPSAASIVQEALAKGAGIHQSESAINKTWKQFEPGVRAVTEMRRLSEKLPVIE